MAHACAFLVVIAVALLAVTQFLMERENMDWEIGSVATSSMPNSGRTKGGEKVSMGQIGNMKGNGCDCFTGVDGKKTCKSMGSDYCPPGACGGRCDGSPPGPQSGYLACKNGTTQCGGGCSVAGPTNMDGCNYETENCGGFCTCQPCSPN